PYLRKFGRFTVPEFIGDRYYSSTARFVAVVCLIFISFTYVAGQMRGVGIVFSRYLEVEIELGLIIGMGVVWVYAVLGGMKGVTYTQVAQYVVLIAAYTVPAVFIAFMLTGNPLPQLAFGSTVADGSYMLEKLNQVVTDLGFAEYTSGTKNTVDMFAITVALMVGTAGLPHVIVRFFTVPRVRDARSSAGWALVFIALLYTVAPAVGAMSRLNLTETIQPVQIHNAAGELTCGDPLAYDNRPEWFRTWENTGLLEYQDLNGDGLIQYYNDADEQLAQNVQEQCGWVGNELVVNRDIMVLANPEIAGLPGIVIALMAAGAVAAALSTAAGLLLVISSAVSHDLMKSMFTPNITEKTELLAGRIGITVAILIAGYLGYNPPGFVAQVVAFAFGLAASSLFPAILMGIFSKTINREGAIAGMLCGLIFTMGYIIYFKGVFIEPIGVNVPENWLFGVSPEGIGAVGMVVNFIVAFVVSKVTKAPPDHIQHLVEDIRVPKGAGGAVAH
ncbi:MAG: sodium:solute symporter family protein, partial [Candidatus Competibacteraceae bacterium]|nr:sodium:solute symporter family protein [Candidatus Competibacteraceae bacterium]